MVGKNSDGSSRRQLAAGLMFATLMLTIGPAMTSVAAPSSIYFATTGYNLSGPLLSYWQGNGDLAVLGYPISRAFLTSDGSTVQYFERTALVLSPQGKVSVALLGTSLTEGQQFAKSKPFTNSSKHVYFKETGHSLNNRFLAYWKGSGSLALFGYPISEPLESSGGRVTQWFERARFEWQESNPDVVTLGLLGQEYLKQHPLGDEATAQEKPGEQAKVVGQAAQQSRPAPVNEGGNSTGDINSRSNAARPSDDGKKYAKWQPLPGAEQLRWYGWCTYFNTDWSELIRLNKGWGNLPSNYKGNGMYAAIPEDITERWHLYGSKVRISYGGKSVDAQLVDVIAYRDIASVRKRGVVVDLSQQVFAEFAPLSKGMLQVDVQVLP